MSVPAPIDARQLAALAGVAWRELRWVLPNVDDEVSRWRQAARRIPAPEIRFDAVSTLADQRFNTEGAALFSTVPAQRSLPLLQLLSRYQIMVDYLDTVSERPCSDMIANGMQLHRALYDALDPDSAPSDYYRFHPWSDDGGYLRALVDSCREACSALPAYDVVRPYALPEAARLNVCGINHELDGLKRDTLLRSWARREFPSRGECTWFELTAAATSSVTVHALLALAASPNTTPQQIVATRAAYFPWISLASTMLDSYADLEADRASGAHSYVGHYPSEETAVARLHEIVKRSVSLARRLPRGRRHALISTGMVAMYLSEPESGTPKSISRSIRREGGHLPALQLPILRTWRRLRRPA
jgi:tetraprenyl-beta-curcumene synthase